MIYGCDHTQKTINSYSQYAGRDIIDMEAEIQNYDLQSACQKWQEG